MGSGGGTIPREDFVGRTLRGREYQIKSVLGLGGMGKVFLTSHIALDMPLALKQCRADSPLPESVISELDRLLNNPRNSECDVDEQHSGDTIQPVTRRGAVTDFPSSGGTQTDRFLREALLLARLHHPSIPALYDYFFEDGYWYLVMDYVPGQTLSAYLREHSTVSPLEALNYAMQLCDVLEYLHQQVPPVVFRDLKPANVIITPDCRLVLVDFNIARYFKEGQLNDTSDLGSPGYAPPEQYQGAGQTDARSDLYSLGVILHEMLSGQHPISVGKQLEPLHTINPSLSLTLSGLVSVATRLEPEYRFQSAYTFYCAMERAYAMEEQHAYQKAVLNGQMEKTQIRRAEGKTKKAAGGTMVSRSASLPLAFLSPSSPLLSSPLPSSSPTSTFLSPTSPLLSSPLPSSSPYTPFSPASPFSPSLSLEDAATAQFLAERQHTREILVETHREREEDDHEKEMTSVDESLHLRAYLSFSSASLPSASEQKQRTESGKPPFWPLPRWCHA